MKSYSIQEIQEIVNKRDMKKVREMQDFIKPIQHIMDYPSNISIVPPRKLSDKDKKKLKEISEKMTNIMRSENG